MIVNEPEPVVIAVLIPCYNEALTVGAVVTDFRQVLPSAEIYVYDNNSTDNTTLVALSAGAIVRKEPLQGKGNVIRRMFADIEADIYVLVDGDDTYDASVAPIMVRSMIDNHLDLVNGSRRPTADASFRLGHRFGNVLLSTTVARIFGNQVDDMLSGLKVMSRRFVKSFPCLSSGFEIETEITVHALEVKMPIAESTVAYKERIAGSTSKLRTLRDGWRISLLILKLLRAERPIVFFGTISIVLALASLAMGALIYSEWIRTGLVLRIPTAILCTGTMLLAFLSAACGSILETVTLGRRELKRMTYLSLTAVNSSKSSVGILARPQ